jgi:hypothetical protein
MLKRGLSIIVLLSAIAVQSFAQFEEGNRYLHLGIGFGSPFLYQNSKMSVPPVHASFEIAVTDKIGVGGLIGYTSSKYEESYGSLDYAWKFSYLILGARGAYHFYNTDKADVYAGAMLGYNVASAKFESNDSDLERFVSSPSVGGLAFGAYVGGRLRFTDKLSGFAEVGYNVAWISVGACLDI